MRVEQRPKAGGAFVQTTRGRVRPGGRFRFTERPSDGFPCIALSDEVDGMVRPQFRGISKVAGHPWHVYVPSGRISWSFEDSVVYVPVDESQES